MIKLNPVGKLPDIDVRLIESAMAKVLGKSGQINLKLVSDNEIRELNRNYAGNDEATDVLSFPYGEGEELGDVAISLETAERQAKATGTELANELGTLIVHGALHILGFDHQSKSQQTEMDRLQADILKRAGLQYKPMEWKHD